MQTEDKKELTPVEMFAELTRLGYIVPADEGSQFTMPGAYRNVPSITTSHSVPSNVVSDERD